MQPPNIGVHWRCMSIPQITNDTRRTINEDFIFREKLPIIWDALNLGCRSSFWGAKSDRMDCIMTEILFKGELWLSASQIALELSRYSERNQCASTTHSALRKAKAANNIGCLTIICFTCFLFYEDKLKRVLVEIYHLEVPIARHFTSSYLRDDWGYRIWP